MCWLENSCIAFHLVDFGEAVHHFWLFTEIFISNEPISLFFKLPSIVKMFWRPFLRYRVPPSLSQFIDNLILWVRFLGRSPWCHDLGLSNWRLVLTIGFRFLNLLFGFCLLFRFLFEWLLFPIVLFTRVSVFNVLTDSSISCVLNEVHVWELESSSNRIS